MRLREECRGAAHIIGGKGAAGKKGRRYYVPESYYLDFSPIDNGCIFAAIYDGVL
jgi:hypothetical protein